MCQAVIVDGGHAVHHAFVGLLDVRRDEQEFECRVGEKLLRDIALPAIDGGDGEVVYLGLSIVSAHEDRPGIDKSPRGIGVILECKLLSLPVLFHDESGLILGIGPLLNPHLLADVRPDMVGTEVDKRQPMNVQQGKLRLVTKRVMSLP